MAFDPSVRQGAHARLASMGKGDNGDMPEDMMMQEPPGSPEGPQAELESLLAMIDPQIADQIRSLVAEMAGGPPEESLEPPMSGPPPGGPPMPPAGG